MPTPRSWATSSTTYMQTRASPPSHTPLHRTRFPDIFSVPPPRGEPRIYPGRGTPQDPFVVDWDLNDPEDPYNWSNLRRWFITVQLASTTFAVSFGSSAYSGGLRGITRDLHISDETAILGISLYVLGFALGPLIFAPLSEMFGRRIVFLVTLSLHAVFQLQGAVCNNLATLLTCRLLTGVFGSSPLTNAGAVVSDIWNFRERGLASAIYSAVPFLGPVLGPVVGGFVADNPRLGWHFNFWLMFILAGIALVLGFFITPETYAPVLLRRRAHNLHKMSIGTIYYSTSYDHNRSKSFLQIMRKNLSRPFVFVVSEPIVLLFAIYFSIVYGTLYALFSAFPIIFQQHKGFSPGQSGLAFLGVGFGIILGTASQSFQNWIYWRQMDESETGRAPPEARLHVAMIGSVLAPAGLWWFSWTSTPNIHWIVPILAGIPFGAGVAQIMQSLTTYLMDTYNVYFASAIAATVVMRSCCGAAFPLFSPAMFDAFGDQWAMSVFAILSTICIPIPMFFWKYGWWIRSKSRVAYKDTESELQPTSATSATATAKAHSRAVEIETSQLDTVCEKETETPTDETAGYTQRPYHRPSVDKEASMEIPMRHSLGP